MIGRKVVRSEVDGVRVDVGAVGVVERVGVVVDVVDLVAGLEGVAAVDPGEGVDELVAPLVGVGGAVEHRWFAKAEAVAADLHLRGTAVDVLREAFLERGRRAAELTLEGRDRTGT